MTETSSTPAIEANAPSASKQEPIPFWAKPILWFMDHFFFMAPGKPLIKVSWSVNAQKISTIFIIYGMMTYVNNFSLSAWLYLSLHGVYGYCWLVKDFAFRDPLFDMKTSLLSTVNGYIFLMALYWIAPWIFISLGIEPTGPEWLVAIAVHTLGITIMMSADGQRHWTLLHKKGLINNGIYKYTRNPNYLGEAMIYFSYAYLANHWISWIVFGWMFVYFLARMKRKDHSISRHPGWAEYKKQTGLIIPWALINGRALADLFRKEQ